MMAEHKNLYSLFLAIIAFLYSQNDEDFFIQKRITIPNYDIDEEILSIEYDIDAKKSEVNQEYVKWKVTETILYNGTNDAMKNLHVDFMVPDPPRNPLPDPRDTHLPPYDVLSSYWKNYLMEQRKLFTENKYIHMKGEQVRMVLQHVFDATEEDLYALENAHDNLNHDPNMDVRKIATYRLGLDFESGVAERLAREALILDVQDGIDRPGFSGVHRFFGEVQDWVMQNSAMQALIRMKAFFMYENLHLPTRQGLDPNRIFNQMGFSMRVMSTPNITGNPTTEGVHQDGSDFSMTVLMKSKNVDYNGGAGRLAIVNVSVPFGTQYQDVNPMDVIDEIQHRNYLDTFIFADTPISHVVSPVYPLDKTKPAHRDIFLSLTRRMAKIGGSASSALIDRELPHPTLPLAFSLKSKHLTKFYPTQTSVPLMALSA